MYKTLFFALLSGMIWLGSMILAFFAGAIVVIIYGDNKKPGHVRYTGPTRRAPAPPAPPRTGDVPIRGE